MDIEGAEPRGDLSLLHKFFSPAEQAWLAGQQADSPLPSLLLWTRKEAVLKLLGCGLRFDPARFDVLAGSIARPPVPADLCQPTPFGSSGSLPARPLPADTKTGDAATIYLVSCLVAEPESLVLSVAAFRPPQPSLHLLDEPNRQLDPDRSGTHQPSLAAASMATALM